MIKYIKTQSIAYYGDKYPDDFPYKHKLIPSPQLDLYINDQISEEQKIVNILNSSFTIDFNSILYVENLIKEVEEVMDGKRDTTGWWYGDGDGTVKVYKEGVELMDAYSSNSGYLPTSEIYALLKDWLEFLKEYYKRSFVPLEWIKEEYMEEAKKLQKPING